MALFGDSFTLLERIGLGGARSLRPCKHRKMLAGSKTRWSASVLMLCQAQ